MEFFEPTPFAKRLIKAWQKNVSDDVDPDTPAGITVLDELIRVAWLYERFEPGMTEDVLKWLSEGWDSPPLEWPADLLNTRIYDDHFGDPFVSAVGDEQVAMIVNAISGDWLEVAELAYEVHQHLCDALWPIPRPDQDPDGSIMERIIERFAEKRRRSPLVLLTIAREEFRIDVPHLDLEAS